MCFFLPSNVRKTLGRGWGRQETSVGRSETARRERTTADTRGGLAFTSGLPMTAPPLRNYDRSPLPVGQKIRDLVWKFVLNLLKSYKLTKKTFLFITNKPLLQCFCDWECKTQLSLYQKRFYDLLETNQRTEIWQNIVVDILSCVTGSYHTLKYYYIYQLSGRGTSCKHFLSPCTFCKATLVDGVKNKAKVKK